MAQEPQSEPLAPAIAEYFASFESAWKPKTTMKYRAELRDLQAWLVSEGKPLTTSSLDFQTLLAYVTHLKAKPAVHGVWRGDPEAVATAPSTSRRSLNSVNASMRAIQGFVLWLFEDGRLGANPFAKRYRRGGRHPLLPREQTPAKGATLADIQALERGCAGRTPLDLRDQAIVAVLKTTMARNSAVRLLMVDDVDLARDVITFPNTKSDRSYEVALHPEAKAAIIRYLHRGRPKLLPHYPVRGMENVPIGEDPGYLFLARDNGRGDGVGPLTDGALSDMIDRRYHAAGGTIRSFRSHRIRHGTATILANNGVPLHELSQQMGHASERTTRIYAKQTPKTIGTYVARGLQESGLTRSGRRRAA